MARSKANWKLFLLTVLAAAALMGCGKNGSNTGYYPTAPINGQLPYYQYPNGNGGYAGYPYNGQPYMNGYNNGSYYGPTGSPYGYNYPGTSYPQYFYPQIPQGFPQSYYPFAPIDNYYRNHPSYGPQYWNQVWNGWQVQAGRWGVSPYNFDVFWNNYCPQIWRSGQTQNIYIQFNRTFYSWAQPGVQIPATTNVNVFWTNYVGVIY